jgi:hypothetical protein
MSIIYICIKIIASAARTAHKKEKMNGPLLIYMYLKKSCSFSAYIFTILWHFATVTELFTAYTEMLKYRNKFLLLIYEINSVNRYLHLQILLIKSIITK